MVHSHPHRASSGLCDGPAIVARVERFCSERRVPFTAMRRRVLEALVANAVPLSAYDLVERLSREKRVAAVQIYRALEFLQGAGVVHRLATRSAYLACDHEHVPGETVVFLLCGACGTVEEATSRSVERGLEGAAAASGFKARQPVVEVEGDCAACQQAP